MDRLQFGIDTFLLRADEYQGLKLGLLTNDVARTSYGMPGRLALQKMGFPLIRLFSPEHGLVATGADGAPQKGGTDRLTGLPVISLYGGKFRPSANELDDLDAVIFDIPDAGCRFYTYTWTLSYMMEACAEAGKKIIVLDRPNPLGGDLAKAEGPMLDEVNCSSFIGRWNIPLRHCCTIGELALYFKAVRLPELELEIVEMKNYTRSLTAMDGLWHFIPTSPAIRDAETALLYPGMGLLEGINLNEGRGTPFDFKVCGAPWINEILLAEAFMSLQLPGITVQPLQYIPDWGLYAGETVHGLRMQVTDTTLFRPVRTGLELLRLLKSFYPAQLRERLYPSAANPDGRNHLDKLTGVKGSYALLATDELISQTTETANWADRIGPCLLY
ncbi:MAG: DUF1343 domain-containing protein [Chitinophagaceae bacterium]|nr:DUF1343 domain-containing protein [Chitinophagaceae bacterium]